MKKITQFSIVALVLLFSIQAKAQKINFTAGYTSSTFVKENGENGIPFFNKLPSYQETDTNAVDEIPGFNIGVSIDNALNDNISIQTGLLFTTKGVKSELNGKLNGETVTVEESYNFRYLNIPINIKYTQEIADDISIFGTAGPYVGFGLIGKKTQTIKIPAEGINQTNESDTDFYDSHKLNTIDFGLGFGLGVGYKAFSLGVNYDLGLANLFDLSLTQNTLRISAGYTISL
jgi:hypothetical protein